MATNPTSASVANAAPTATTTVVAVNTSPIISLVLSSALPGMSPKRRRTFSL